MEFDKKWLVEIANRVLDECEYNGKTIREWADLIANPKTKADRIRTMTDEDRELSRWVPVDEQLPEENVCVLVWGGYFAKVMETAILDGGLFYSAWDNRTKMFGVTHWMPLPQAPDATDIDVGNKEKI